MGDAQLPLELRNCLAKGLSYPRISTGSAPGTLWLCIEGSEQSMAWLVLPASGRDEDFIILFGGIHAWS